MLLSFVGVYILSFLEDKEGGNGKEGELDVEWEQILLAIGKHSAIF